MVKEKEMLVTDMDPEELFYAYSNPEVQACVIEWVANLKGYERFDDETFLSEAVATSIRLKELLPFDEVILDGKREGSPSAIIMVTALHLLELGLIPPYEK